MTNINKSIPVELDGNASYLVRMRSVNSFGVPSNWSDFVRVNTQEGGTGSSRVVSTDGGFAAYDEDGRLVFQYANSTQVRTNLIVNPSMEVNTSGWTALTNSTIARDTSDFFAGEPGTYGCMRITSSSSATNVGVVTSVGDRQNASAGESYTAAAYVKVPDGSTTVTVRIGIRFYDGSGTLISELLSPATTQVQSGREWIRTSCIGAIAPVGTSKVGIALINTAQQVSGEYFQADAFLLEQTATLKEYFDGSSSVGATGWSGTAHYSTSVMNMSASVHLDAPNITQGVFRTSQTVESSGGVIVDPDGLRGYSPLGVVKVEIDAATGDITALDGTFTGSTFRTGLNVGIGATPGLGVIFDNAGIRGYSGTDPARVFEVDINGNLYARNADITGVITATSGSFTGSISATTGAIGGWQVAPTALYSNSGQTGMSSGATPFWAGGATPNAVFAVNSSGHLKATSVNIAGNVSATSGDIAGWTIGTNEIYKGSGTTKVALAATATPKIYIGTGNHGTADTAFYADSLGRFSLGDQLIFNPSASATPGTGDFAELTVTGKIRGAIENATLIPSNKLQVNITGVNITSSTAATITTASNAFLTNEYILITGLTGNASSCNGVWPITVTSPTTFNITITGGVVSNTTGITGAVASLREVTLGLHPSEGTGSYSRSAGIGLRLDSYNWWMTNNQFRVGTSGTYMKWNGTRFDISGGGTKTLSMAVGAADADNYIAIANNGITPAYNSSTTQFIVNAEGKMSLGTALTWDGSNLTVTGAVSGGTIDIGGLDGDSFHVDSSGNMWLGSGLYSTAPFRVSAIGSLDIGGTDASSLHIDNIGRLWAGHNDYASAPFYINNNGDMYASNAVFENDITANSNISLTDGYIYANTGAAKFGMKVDPGATLHGLYIDTNNYWYTNGTMRLGGSTGLNLSAGNITMGSDVSITGSTGEAATAAKWTTSRTITLGGDLTGNVSIDGSANVTLTATIAADSIVLGTDTTGNYIATIAGTTNQVNVSGSGSESAAVTLSLPQSIHTTATPTFGNMTLSQSGGGAKLNLSGVTSNWINFSNVGVGAPTFTTSSAGTKIILFPSIGASTADYAMGIEANTIWSSVPTSAAGYLFKWYGGTTEAMRLTGSGVLTVLGNTVWHAGNDGASSTLDADLLDGQHGSYYQDWTNITNKPDPVITLGGVLSGSVTLTDLASGTLTASYVADSLTLGTHTTGNYVASVSSGTGISVSGTGEGAAVTVTNTGVTSLAGTTNQITASAATGSVTLSLPQNINTGATTTFLSSLLTNGEVSGGITKRQLEFFYPGSLYGHNIKTRHNAGAQLNNAIDFYVWRYGTDATPASGTARVASLDFAQSNFYSPTVINSNLTVTGNLQVDGTTITVSSASMTVSDPIITLGGSATPASDDNKDRGIKYHWHNGSVGKVGYFGYDDSTGKFTFIPDATDTLGVFSGTKGEVDANVDWTNILNKPDPVVTVTLTGDVTGTGNATLTDLANGTISFATTIAANSVALGTDTTGNYIATIAGTTNQVNVSGSGSETAAVTLSLPQSIHTAAIPTFGQVLLSEGTGNTNAATLARFGSVSTGGTLDWNDASNARPGTGYSLLLGSATNGPGGGTYFHPFNLEFNSKTGAGNVTQLAIPYGHSAHVTAPIYMRGSYVGVWSSWYKIYTSASDGAGSGMDADLLDAQEGSYYLDLTNATSTLVDTKLATISTADKVSLSALNIDGGTDIGAALADADLFIVDDGGAGTNRKAAATRISDYVFGKVSSDITITTAGVATASTNILRSEYLSTRSLADANNADAYGVMFSYLNGSNKPTGTDHAAFTMSYSTSWSTQMAADWRTNNWYVRTQNNTTWGSWATLWHSDNDGASSGLDADLLDGQHGSYYNDWTNVTNKPDPVVTVNLTGDVTGSGNATLTDLASGTINIATTVATSTEVSDTAPVGPTTGQLWFNSSIGKLFIYFDSSWVQVGGIV